MTIIECPNLKQPKLICIDNFDSCIIDGTTKLDIIKLYPSRSGGAYYLNKFNNFLIDKHKIDIKQYCIVYGKIEWPKCPGTGKEVGYKICGKGIILNTFSRGGVKKNTNLKFKEHCERMSLERTGLNNPMYGQEAWNKGLTAKNNASIAEVSKKMSGRKMGETQKEKLKQARAKHPTKARHTTPHSLESKDKMRRATVMRWSQGRFNRRSSIHIIMFNFLNSLNLKEKFEEEWAEVYYSIDFALPNLKIAIECDGDYFHINPQFFPNGPKDAIQRRNIGRDKAKNTFLSNRGWKIIRFWECEINSGIFKENLICKLKEFGALDR